MNIASRLNKNPYWQMSLTSWLSLQRMPAYSLPTLLFPIMFYAFFGLVMARGYAQPMMITFSCFGVLGTAMFAFGIGAATERAQGWWLLLRAAPMPLSAMLTGKLVAVMAFSLLIILGIAWLAALFGDVRLTTVQWLALFVVLLAGAIPFSLLGLALGLWLSPNAAPGVINLIYLPLAFLSGLWIPVSQLPGPLQGLAEWLPPYHLAGLALHFTGTHSGPWVLHIGVLLLFTALCAGLVALSWRRFQGS
jgi:ABC-2 type transport system permease protein